MAIDPHLLLLQIGHERDEEIRWSRIAALHRSSPDASVSKAARDWLDSPVAQRRRLAADVLSQSRFSDDPEENLRLRRDMSDLVLRRALEEGSPQVVRAMVVALCYMLNSDAIPWIVSLGDSEDPDMRKMIAGLLPHFGLDPRIVELLTNMLSDHDEGVRDWATFAFIYDLKGADSETIRSQLWNCVSDESLETQQQAILALALRSDERVVGPLSSLLLDIEIESAAYLVDAAVACRSHQLAAGVARLASSRYWKDHAELQMLNRQLVDNNS